MKAARFLTIIAVAMAAGCLYAQNPADVLIEPVATTSKEPQKLAEQPADNVPSALPEASNEEPSDQTPPAAPTTTPAPEAPATPVEEQQEMKKSEEGFIIKDAGLNDIFQFLAKAAGRQYFHNAKIAGPEFLVTGHLNEGNPLEQMEELAFMYGLSLHTKGNTIYALTSAQLAQLPSAEFHYQLRYLRPTDMEQIKELIKPMLSPGTGIVNFEPKTNTIIIIDSAHRIEQARELLHGIDKAKGQIIVETKILRVNSGAAERTGVNWSSSLGKDGTNLNVIAGLNSIFGLDSPVVTTTKTTTSKIISDSLFSTPPPTTTTTDSNSFNSLNTRTSSLTSSANLVLTPLQLSGVLRALAEGGLASQVSNPTLITEDNEQATISIIDRVPIITTTTTASVGAAQPTVTEEVRYKIDTSDKSIDTDPDKHREIGISLVVTPTLLPDGTVRMKMRPRSAQIVEKIKSITGNEYPRVTESMIETLARVPDGHSLVVGGFYGEAQIDGKTKVPILGDIPVLNFFFKSKDATKEKTSLVFIVTPKSYDPSNGIANRGASERLRSATTLDCDHDWIDPENPGQAHEANLQRSLRGLQPVQAPYFPRVGESSPSETPSFSRPRFGKGKR
jgi:type II secretory pathway component GspD/PulD (secretin)